MRKLLGDSSYFSWVEKGQKHPVTEWHSQDDYDYVNRSSGLMVDKERNENAFFTSVQKKYEESPSQSNNGKYPFDNVNTHTHCLLCECVCVCVYKCVFMLEELVYTSAISYWCCDVPSGWNLDFFYSNNGSIPSDQCYYTSILSANFFLELLEQHNKPCSQCNNNIFILLFVYNPVLQKINQVFTENFAHPPSWPS